MEIVEIIMDLELEDLTTSNCKLVSIKATKQNKSLNETKYPLNFLLLMQNYMYMTQITHTKLQRKAPTDLAVVVQKNLSGLASQCSYLMSHTHTAFHVRQQS